ncbi:MAG: ParA family protein, partial [Flammeovirgaceae bacterium]
VEDPFIADYERAVERTEGDVLKELLSEPRSLHFHLKATEDGIKTIGKSTPAPYKISKNLHLIPGRLSFQSVEEKLVTQWGAVFGGDPQSLRLVSSIRDLAGQLNSAENYDYVVIDTSPSLGRLNRLIVSMSDVFLVPCTPDLFSLYG